MIILLILAVMVLSPNLAAQERPPIIDMHMHARMDILRQDGAPVPVPCMVEPCEPPPSDSRTGQNPLQGTIEAMDRYNIVLGFLGDPVEDVYKWVDAAPGRFFPSAGWSSPFPDTSALRQAYLGGRLRGMGEIGTQYVSIAPSDPRLEPYFALAEELDIPVHIHTAGFGARVRGFRSALGRPLELEEVLVRHPDLRIYLENAGYPFLDDMIALLTQYPQVYADLSTVTWILPRSAFHRYLRALIDAGFEKRLMFGSDQMHWPEAIGMAIDASESAEFLTDEQKRDIFYNNAVRFLRLDSDTVSHRTGYDEP